MFSTSKNVTRYGSVAAITSIRCAISGASQDDGHKDGVLCRIREFLWFLQFPKWVSADQLRLQPTFPKSQHHAEKCFVNMPHVLCEAG